MNEAKDIETANESALIMMNAIQAKMALLGVDVTKDIWKCFLIIFPSIFIRYHAHLNSKTQDKSKFMKSILFDPQNKYI